MEYEVPKFFFFCSKAVDVILYLLLFTAFTLYKSNIKIKVCRRSADTAGGWYLFSAAFVGTIYSLVSGIAILYYKGIKSISNFRIHHKVEIIWPTEQ